MHSSSLAHSLFASFAKFVSADRCPRGSVGRGVVLDGADRLPVVVRFPAGPGVSLKTVDPPKGNGLGQKKKVRIS